MLKKLMFVISLALISTGLWMPRDVDAWLFRVKSFDCSHLVKGGTNTKTSEQAFVCGLNVKEIATKCVNKGGNADNASDESVFAINGVVLKQSVAGSNVKTKNGTISVEVEITDDDILKTINEFNYDCAQGNIPGCTVADLTDTCPNGNFTFAVRVSRADALAMSVLEPKQGSAKFESITKTYPATVDPRYATNPNLVDPDGDGFIQEQVPIADVMRDCRRGQSKLHFYYADGSQVSDTNFNDGRIQDCLIFRDVNNNSAFSLISVGTYDPDVNHFDYPSNTATIKTFDSPFDGTSDAGGVWLTNDDFAVGTYYTATCHQHGNETGSGGWTQSGPKKPDYDVLTGLQVPGTGDINCTGGSQLGDGVYGDGIVP